MPEYLAPGVYVEEVDAGPVPIEGVSTSTCGFVGLTQRGTAVGLPVLVTSFRDFQRNFGGYFDASTMDPSFGPHLFLPHAVEGFFNNGGKRVYIMRVKAPGAATASVTPKGGLITRLRPGEDAMIGTNTIKPLTLRGIEKGTAIVLNTVVDGLQLKSISLKVVSINRSTEEVTLDKNIDFDPIPTKFEAAFTRAVVASGTTPLTADAALAQKKAKVASVAGLVDGNTVQLRMVKNGVTYESDPLTIDVGGINAGTGELTFTANITLHTADPVSFEARRTTVTTDTKKLAGSGAIDTASAVLNSFKINAANEGAWGNRISVQVTHTTGARSPLDLVVVAGGVVASGVDNNQLALISAAGFYKNGWVEIDRGDDKIYRRVKNVVDKVVTLEGPALNAAAVAPQAPATDTVLSICEFRLTASYGDVVEQFANLTLENVADKFCVDEINNASSLIQIDPASLTATRDPFVFPSAADGLTITLGSGTDGAAPPGDNDYRGVDGGPGQRSGIRALEDIDEISIIAAPGLVSQVVQNALIEQCTRLMDRFAILDPKPKTGGIAPDLNDIQNQRQLFDTKYAAIYYPRLMVSDPISGAEIAIPPSGHMAGIYARTDIERGVHKAPANEVIRGILGLELTVNKGEQDILNPKNINVLRDFRADSRGYRVWGARCMTSDAAWKYVPVRRLFIFLEESIDQGTQWVVFEPNDEPLWARVRQSVTNFLTRVWRDGALMGATPEQAFFVKCDLTTMTQDDIDNGRLIMLIGVAPVKPAEFVIIRIGQKAGGASIDEL
jgi:Phage tail sheath protein FI